MDDLLAIRPALLELHRELLAAERTDMERFQGRLTGAEFLQIATDSLRLAWLAPLLELIVEIDEATGQPGQPISVGAGPISLAVGSHAIWVANRDDHSLSLVDPLTGFVRDGCCDSHGGDVGVHLRIHAAPQSAR